MYQVNLSESYFPAQASSELRELSFGDLLREAASDSADRLALVEVLPDGTTYRQWSYAELLLESEGLARDLLQRFKPLDCIAIWAPNQVEWMLAQCAIALAGMTLVTINPSLRIDEAEYILKQSKSVGLFYCEDCRGNPIATMAVELQQRLPSLQQVINIIDVPALADNDSNCELPLVDPYAPMQIQYTSGTTSFPKGVLLSHRSALNNACAVLDRMSVERYCKILHLLPMFHCTGSITSFIGGISHRGACYALEQFDPVAAIKVVADERLTLHVSVPAVVMAMLEAHKTTRRDLTSMRAMSIGGALVLPELVDEATEVFGCVAHIGYGQTEVSPAISFTWAGDSLEDFRGSVGQAMPDTEISIRDASTLALLPLDTIGEVCVRSYAVMIGYNQEPAKTADTVTQAGWLRTGDLGCIDSRGYIKITGRIKEMIIRGGENLYPLEIENCMLTRGDLERIAVIGIPDKKWGEIAVCFFLPKPGSGVTAERLKEFCREHLSPQKAPSVWLLLEDSRWPLTALGKVRKAIMRDQFITGDFNDLLPAK